MIKESGSGLLRGAIVTAVLALSACANGPTRVQDTSSVDGIQAELTQAISVSAPVMSSADIGKALLPPMSFPGEQVGDSDERFHIAVNRVPAREFFIGLVKGTGFNMVVHPDVEGRITLDLQSVTVDEVMEVVQSMYGYSFKKRGNIYHVLPDGLRTEMFHINYLNISRRGDSQIQVSAGQVSDVGSKGSGDSSSSIGPSTGMGTKITTSSTTDFWSELDQTLRLFIGGTEGQSIVMTPQAGVVVVRAMSDELDAVKSYLESAELILRRQVIIEAKILEVELNDGFQSGVNWSLLGKPSAGKTVGVGTTSADISSLSQIGGVFSAAASLSDFNGMINLLESQGNVQVLSSPRISTVNNQKAVIKVGSDRFFVTEVSSTQSSESNSGTDNNNFQSPTVELTPFFSGIALDVTPQISENDEVILHIHPSISTVKEEQKSIKAFGVQSDLPLAVSSIRETDSIVYAKSGQVVVIGGLMQNGSEDSDAGMPGLHNIPILGHLFKQKRSSSKKSELVILLRPRVIGPEGWNEMLQESSDQFEYLRNKMLPQ